jgi:alpha-glucosidase
MFCFKRLIRNGFSFFALYEAAATMVIMNDVWWRNAVIYQIYPRSFNDRDGDGVGDLPGIMEKLDYVASLGVDGVWISPFYVSPMADFGYDVADYRDVDPCFGSLEDFDTLIARAHALDLKVIVDMVWAHTSEHHAWFKSSRLSRIGPQADWYVWVDAAPDGTPPNNWLSVFGGGAWSWEPRRRQYYLHHFLPAQPKLKLSNPAVMAALLDIAQFWLDRGVDGFRFDAVDFLAHDERLRSNPARAVEVIPVKPYHLQQHSYDLGGDAILPLLGQIRAVMDRYPAVMAIAEVGSETTDVASLERVGRYSEGDRGFHAAYSLAQMKSKGDAAAIRTAIAEAERCLPSGGMIWAFSNHDVVRVATRWGDGSAVAAKLFMALLLSLRGGIFIYQGEELGLPEADIPYESMRDPYGLTYWPDFKGRDGCRTPMPWRFAAKNGAFSTAEATWLPVPQAHLSLAVDIQDSDPGSVLNACRRFLAWRKDHAALRHGTLRLLETAGPLVAFERSGGNERLYCAFNLSAAPIELGPPVGEAVSPCDFPVSISKGVVRLPGFGAYFARLPTG